MSDGNIRGKSKIYFPFVFTISLNQYLYMYSFVLSVKDMMNKGGCNYLQYLRFMLDDLKIQVPLKKVKK